jgi:hypothetical protein
MRSGERLFTRVFLRTNHMLPSRRSAGGFFLHRYFPVRCGASLQCRVAPMLAARVPRGRLLKFPGLRVRTGLRERSLSGARGHRRVLR